MAVTAADTIKRTITGTIVTWNEQGNTSVGPTVFAADSIEIKPVKLLLEHDRTRPIGKMVSHNVTADLSVIPVAPPLKKVPPTNAEIALDAEFISRYISSKNALPDVETFTLLMNKKGVLELVIGHSSINSNRIKLNVTTKNGKDKVAKNISFNANHLKEILIANKDCTDATLKVSDAGLSVVEFTCGEFTANYYLVELKTID